MKTYKIEIEEILQEVFDVEAKSLDEALNIAKDKYYEGEYELSSETIKETDFRPFKDSTKFLNIEDNMENEIKIREELYSKLEKEYNSFIDNLKKCSAEKIIDKAYEMVMKEELCIMFYPQNNQYNINQIKALNKTKNPLQKLYNAWMNSDCGIHQVLEDSTFDLLEKLIKEQKNKSMERL